MSRGRAVIIGAGIGGLAAAIDLAVRGLDVCVVERKAGPGGKLAAVAVGPSAMDAGPTVLTMRDVFDGLFADAGASLNDYLDMRPLAILARHAWDDGARLDLFADRDRSADAIADFAGLAESKRYLEFCARSRQIFETLDSVFMRSQRPDPISLAISAAPGGLGNLWRISPFATLWQALGRYFHDQRLRQLFARYATYCGSSPFAAPATLMLVAHAEQMGVWTIDGGMHRLAGALARLAKEKGVTLRYGDDVKEVLVASGRTQGVRLATSEHILADIVICNADVAAVSSGLFGAKAASGAPKAASETRSSSAMTWHFHASTSEFPLHRHNVFFSADYKLEFEALAAHRLPRDPTVYVCAQDRGDGELAPSGSERLMCLINAPPIGDRQNFDTAEIDQCTERTFRRLEACGLRITNRGTTTITTPADFHRMYPATGGALYGRASHGWMASFQRAGARTQLPGLYLAGGSVHPGPGMPMAAISGRLAAQCVIGDLSSTGRSRKTAIRGGMSMR